jgi:hypothetical protein
MVTAGKTTVAFISPRPTPPDGGANLITPVPAPSLTG